LLCWLKKPRLRKQLKPSHNYRTLDRAFLAFRR
jgi:hypothetical protein